MVDVITKLVIIFAIIVLFASTKASIQTNEESIIGNLIKRAVMEEENKTTEDRYIVISTNKLNGGNTTGRIWETHKGREIYAFQGIPYVDMPTRFMRPGNVKTGYDVEIIATSFGDICLQASRTTFLGERIAIGNEDCLFINVYTPKIPSRSTDRLPVMVFIHGGQNVHGDASAYMPTRLLDEDVVLVTFHYRLGALSFYSTGTDGDHPGNLALYDQNVALKWVNKYISDFGGDKNKVTLFGQDAGAISAIYHLITGRSKDIDAEHNEITLFHAVIAQSGSALDPLAFDADGEATSVELAAAAGCKTGDVKTCMSNLEPEKLALAADNLAQDRNIHFPYLAPAIDVAFITCDPLSLIMEAQYENLPLMLGTCTHEGSFVFGELYSHYLVPDKYKDEDYLKYNMVPEVISLAGITDTLGFVTSSLYDTYLYDVDRTNFTEMTPGMIDMTGALFSKAGILETAKLSYENYQNEVIIDRNDAGIFLYSFEYNGEASAFQYHFFGVDEKPEFTDEEIGVTHGDDLLYLLTISSLNKGDDELTMERMVKMWANFATHHNPTPVGGSLGVNWEPFSNSNQKYLSIADELEVMEDYEERYTILVDEGGIDWPFPPSSTTTSPDPTTTTPSTGPTINITSPDPTTTTPSAGPTITITSPDPTTTTPSTGPTITTPPTTETTMTTRFPEFPPDHRCSCKKLADAEDASKSYMIAMIIFIVFFVIVTGVAFYLYFKTK